MLNQNRTLGGILQKKPKTPTSQIERLLADARLKLVETGTRNRLVHTPRTSKRTRSISILNIEADSLFKTIARTERALNFLPEDPARQLSLDPPGTLAARTEALSTPGLHLQTGLEEEALEKRLLAMYRDAKTAEEEQGINILFLAVGFLRWYEDDRSDVMREAPLILVPVTLARDLRRSSFCLRGRDEDISANQAIQERLRTDFGVILPEIPEDEDWLPSTYFDEIAQLIAGKSRWSIDFDGVELGFYSFSKLLMIRDLEIGSWGENEILENPLLRGLLTDGFSEEPPAISNDTKLDEHFAPADLIQVVDADSSQTVVIENVRAGRNLVVQGPPGTGKSQTITNIIASAVHDGKTVLFVAEKMAALNVVHARLRKAGLGPICLELHSRGANKKQVLAEIEATLSHDAGEPDAEAQLTRLTEIRDTLNDVADRMHVSIGNTGSTPFQALSRLIAAAHAGAESHPPLLEEAEGWSQADYASILQSATRLVEITANAGPCFRHAFYGAEATSLQPAELARLSGPLNLLADAATALAALSAKAFLSLDVTVEITLESCSSVISILQLMAKLSSDNVELAEQIASQNLRRILEAAEAGLALSRLKAKHAETFVDAAWSVSPLPMRTSLALGLSFFGRFKGDYRRASKLLATLVKAPVPKKVPAKIELVDALIEVENARTDMTAHDAAMNLMAPLHWRGEKTDFKTLFDVATVMQALKSHEFRPPIDRALEIARSGDASDLASAMIRLVAELFRSLEPVFSLLKINTTKAFLVADRNQVPIESVGEKAKTWRASLDRFDEWRRLSAADAQLRGKSAQALADALATGAIPAGDARAILDCTHDEVVWKKAVEATPDLQDFFGPSHDALAEEFRALEVKQRRTNVEIVRAKHAAGIPRGSLGAMNTIRSEIKRKRGHMPIRKLFRTAGETLQRIKPVLLMSPISVAQFLPPGTVHFDLLVIDEASQVRPEDALGLIARSTQIVVVGDNKQLPPTSFFERVVADEEETGDEIDDTPLAGAAKATEIESILALCEVRGLNTAMLRWHYRSRHPSLIEVSNAEFYGRLIIPPAPSMERTKDGLILTRVPGAYDRGGKRINIIEAEAVVKAMARHARTSPDVSIGIVTFSSVQRDAISDLLEIARRTDDALDELLREGKTEDVFVKNLENVQGDERDVIFVSVGYGPRVAGARLDSMSFGPVSPEGGERRLNVLFTRARNRCEIFCSFAAGDIDTDRARGEGPRVLKRFLRYAETGILEEQVSTSDDFDSPFEEAVAAIIESFGYKVDKQVGSAGFKIDLAVRDPRQPGRHILAIECDGATYHRALWARERDRLRQEVLENLGWRFHRIWSTDWFYRRGAAIEQIKAALEAAKSARPAPPKIKKPPVDEPAPAPAPQPPILRSPVASDAIMAYKLTSCPTPYGVEPHLASITEMTMITKTIVETEGPIHEDEIARRVTSLFGKSRTGSLISAAALKSLQPLKRTGVLLANDGFWMTPQQAENPPVRDRSAAPLTLQRADMLSPLEIRAASKIALEENGLMSPAEMAIAVTRLLGFKRAGPDLKVAIENALQTEQSVG